MTRAETLLANQKALTAHLDKIGAPAKSRRFEATCVTCGTKHTAYAAVERCARSHGGGRVLVNLWVNP